ncbi:MAG TPA: DUF58 domain-containing protein, partial [Pyrinomonadaceae bacterium]|nr:DUF58 domain-containing protein [Pyrinomonadaceae bacterium]
PLAKSAGREASQLNLPFEVTTGGAIMIALLAVVGFSAWNTGNNLLFLIFSFLAAMMIIGFFAGSLTLKKLDVKMRFPDTIFAGEETPILVSLHNQKRIFGSYSIVAEVRGREREESVAAAHLRKHFPGFIAERLSKAPLIRKTLDYFVHVPHSEVTENTALHVFPGRGRFLIKDFELSTKFPFGFFRHRRRLAARETELFVFPKVEKLDREIDDLPLDAGKLVANKRGSGQDLLSLRDYRPNDDLRRVDWKATARARDLIVREFAADDDKRITVVVDDRLPAKKGENPRDLRAMLDAEQKGQSIVISDRFERGLSLATSLLDHFSEDQAELKLIVGGEQGEFGLGRGHLHECLKRLAVAQPRFVDRSEAGKVIQGLEDLDSDSENHHVFIISAVPGGGSLPETPGKGIMIEI